MNDYLDLDENRWLEPNVARPPYDAMRHIEAELEWLDLLLLRRVMRMGQGVLANDADEPSHNADGPARPITFASALPYIGEAEVVALLLESNPSVIGVFDEKTLAEKIDAVQQTIATETARCLKEKLTLPLATLANLFDLSWLEINIVLLVLAPELRRKYDRIYAYLQDDITRKRPSLDLALEVFFHDENDRWQARRMLDENSRLLAYGIIHIIDDPQSPSGSTGLASFLTLDPKILQFCLGNNQLDPRIFAVARRVTPSVRPFCACSWQSEHIYQMALNNIGEIDSPSQSLHHTEAPVFHLHGNDETVLADLARSVVAKFDCGLLMIETDTLFSENGPLRTNSWELLACCFREALLQQTPILLANIDLLIGYNVQARGLLVQLATLVNQYESLVFTTAKSPWPQHHSDSLAVVNIAAQTPEYSAYRALWGTALAALNINGSREDILAVCQRYTLSSAQVHAVVKQLRVESLGEPISVRSLANACRAVSHHHLRNLSTHVPARYEWDDLVLPHEDKQQLRFMCTQVQHQHTVFEHWGFSHRLPYGRGLSAMFTGSPGTGKTMAAQVIANELQLDLFKIDLSGVVSKYIGETEKNLDRVFREAKASKAILFFDEADALFGKRTDVSDAHDRYANIEVSYLLQKIEEYDGIVILATNYRNNIDEAFIRRIRFIIEFMFPDDNNRVAIFEKSMPPELPLHHELDLQWLAERIKVSGGNIKNIVLNAAFLAAQENSTLSMSHLLDSSRLEFKKIGKLWDPKRMTYTPKAGVGEGCNV
ncbi:ATP-binding protein [Teredinibacter purpureus]|uniref:ATP-binding protein n=1 Tax=Teredinibacter purpureus TaxID=2731756 RepID=UPI0005F84139|nr:AAA family ATPase [Teredinibacter purpureus]